MLSIEDAVKEVREDLPTAKFGYYVELGDVYILQIFIGLPGEEEMAPFYRFNRKTGEFDDFSIVGDPEGPEVAKKFTNERKKVPT